MPSRCVPYKNAALPIPDRVADLLSRMTLEEKIEQINWGWQQKVDVVDPTNTYTAETARKALGAEWGGDIQLTPRKAAILRNAVQRYQIEKTRLGIPVMFPGEALHGYMEYGSTSFPQALGLASTWDRGAGEAHLHRHWRRSGLARLKPGLLAGARHRPRSALGPDRRDARRRSVSRLTHGRRRD